MKPKTKKTPLVEQNPIPKDTFLAGDVLYPCSQLGAVIAAQLTGTPLPSPKFP